MIKMMPKIYYLADDYVNLPKGIHKYSLCILSNIKYPIDADCLFRNGVVTDVSLCNLVEIEFDDN